MKDTPLYVLGICNPFNEPNFAEAKLPNGNLIPLKRTDLIGLRDFYRSKIFPIGLNHFYLVLLIDSSKLKEGGKTVTLTFNHRQKPSIQSQIILEMQLETMGEGNMESTRFFITSYRELKWKQCFPEPGEYDFYVINGNNEKIHVGYITLLYRKAPDLTDLPPNVINAIRSNPRAAQAVRLILNCIICRSGIKTYTTLERDDKKCDAIWYRNLPDVFQCECGNTRINLRYLKENLQSAGWEFFGPGRACIFDV